MKYRLSLYEGTWTPRLSRRAIQELLDDLDGWWTVVDYVFVQPDEDVAFSLEVIAISSSCDAEHIRDGLIEAFLCRFEPEFESMIEIEVENAC